ncbi:(d)CMP kinase [Hyphobacterium sp. HN65]|uniref:Cytidylate kinase n=1 Tax=Hyphobacterium lacteum TaxID=3116575 RepID=A0ABU7LSQ2_9PROT|nr:(d)CMP kinase [Hyphobacterium sp. HN65]MEE2526946.1 (d)CMP kinase [Hyphobacterium sp. HN65]
MIIAVDGTLASGKGTVARGLARHFGLPHLDTGALYRAVAVAVLSAGGDPRDPETARAAARALDPSAIAENAIRTAEAGAAASVVAVQQGVRDALFDLQKRFAEQPGGAVLDGRDIGTVVCPHADVKFYVDADPAVRAERRWRELAARGDTVSLEEIRRQLDERDRRDSSRETAPLMRAEDAILLDTTHLSIDATLAEAVRIVQNKTDAAPRT